MNPGAVGIPPNDPVAAGVPPACAELAARQLAAYNAHDLDAFCACYADDVRVLDHDGNVTLEGAAAFRERYGALFSQWEVGAAVDTRVVAEPHVVDDERWWRTPKGGGERLIGHVLVRYTARDGRIVVAQFFREGT